MGIMRAILGSHQGQPMAVQICHSFAAYLQLQVVWV